MSGLEETLVRLSQDFANQIVAALLKLPVEALYEELAIETPKTVKKRAAAATRGPSKKKATVIEAAPEVAPQNETELSLLEHLNEAGATGSTVRAWVISTQGELEHDEHSRFENEATAVLEALESKGLIQKRAFSRSRGQVYALAPVA